MKQSDHETRWHADCSVHFGVRTLQNSEKKKTFVGKCEAAERTPESSIPFRRTRQLDVDCLFRLIHFVILAESFPTRRNDLNQELPARNFRNVADSREIRLQIHLDLLVLGQLACLDELHIDAG